MRPGEITPSGHVIVVSPPCAQSQPTHVMWPDMSIATCPPVYEVVGVSTLPLSSVVVEPVVMSHVPVDTGGNVSHRTFSGGASAMLASACCWSSPRPHPPQPETNVRAKQAIA